MGGDKSDSPAALRDGSVGSQRSPTSSVSASTTLGGDASPAFGQMKSPKTTLSSPKNASPDAGVNALLSSAFFKSDSQFFKESDDNQVDQQQGSPVQNRLQTPRYIPTQPSSHYRSRNNGAFGKNQSNGYRSSKSWYSPENQRFHDFQVIRNAMRRLFKKADVAKWTYDDYIKHLEAMLASKSAYLAKILATRERDRIQKLLDQPKFADQTAVKKTMDEFLPNHNPTMKGNRSRVLGKETIWCLDWRTGKEEIADWPTLAEMKWEGDDRAKTGVGRFPPLPRERGPPTISWNQLAVIEQYELDEVARIPTLEDVLLPVDEIPLEDMDQFIIGDVIEAIDEYVQS
ncbi:hypothetical protein DM02DRAFT_622503 [Periconia macrospinosa]|uniref:Uncharacterized protein n=1 Tax=Periconia macrospinosa TaxID=97972 RepID=A0A2V1EAE9_9PLEO|nr:hypothetical protein DM02DRAFT_622503 [Periconia macrospinosa]